ncbi:hypothetical protein [Actinokineospora sp. NBRC 105648]|uniref:hypothetical protein n=1 Tax=Actinokineospora sp. NBRC 105648 TaxID=3032206 RepID=UPI0024A18054|nr:hypothetical protein [Actinokineospora sp. NBRC 105648]GLZ43685.1 hypothetical protein Acsp05_73090 [Actinokineospora sp. NBRC 105648]
MYDLTDLSSRPQDPTTLMVVRRSLHRVTAVAGIALLVLHYRAPLPSPGLPATLAVGWPAAVLGTGAVLLRRLVPNLPEAHSAIRASAGVIALTIGLGLFVFQPDTGSPLIADPVLGLSLAHLATAVGTVLLCAYGLLGVLAFRDPDAVIGVPVPRG